MEYNNQKYVARITFIKSPQIEFYEITKVNKLGLFAISEDKYVGLKFSEFERIYYNEKENSYICNFLVAGDDIENAETDADIVESEIEVLEKFRNILESFLIDKTIKEFEDFRNYQFPKEKFKTVDSILERISQIEKHFTEVRYNINTPLFAMSIAIAQAKLKK